MVGGEAGKGDKTSWDVGPDPELAAGLTRSVFREGTGRHRGWSGERLIYYNYVILSLAATVTFYGAPVSFR